jgi:hypothetical protein
MTCSEGHREVLRQKPGTRTSLYHMTGQYVE